MGNLEKAGVLVVVALLAVILVVAFLNFPEQNIKSPPVLGASAGRVAHADMRMSGPKPEPMNVLPTPPSADVIRPKVEADRPSSDPAPSIFPDNMVTKELPPPAPVLPKLDDTADRKPVVVAEKPLTPPPSGYPKVVKVQPGESLWTIAVREYGAKAGPRMLGLIADANPKVRPEALKTGTEITLPAPSAELAEAKPKSEADKKPAAPPAGPSAKAPATAPKPVRKLPFTPN